MNRSLKEVDATPPGDFERFKTIGEAVAAEVAETARELEIGWSLEMCVKMINLAWVRSCFL